MSFELHKGNTSPSLGETIRVDGNPFDLAGCSARFKMRPELLETPLTVDAAATIVTASTTLSGAHVLPEDTLTVASTSGFLDSGALLLGGQIVFYEAKTATTFLGCTRGSGMIASGTAVAQIGGVRYDWVAADVAATGHFRAWFEITLPSGKTQDTSELDVEILAHGPVTRPLCALRDVLRYVPAYESEPAIDELLEELIAGESVQAHQETGREFVAIVGQNTRLFRLTPRQVRTRRVRIGDCAIVTTVRLLDEDATTLLETVAATGRLSLPQTRAEWEPIRQIELLPVAFGGPVQLAAGRYLEVAGTWGFPQIPANLRQAVAKLVVVRTVGNPAFEGTSFADALNESDINVGSMLASARDAIRRYSDGPFA